MTEFIFTTDRVVRAFVMYTTDGVVGTTDGAVHTSDRVNFYNPQSGAYNRESKHLQPTE